MFGNQNTTQNGVKNWQSLMSDVRTKPLTGGSHTAMRKLLAQVPDFAFDVRIKASPDGRKLYAEYRMPPYGLVKTLRAAKLFGAGPETLTEMAQRYFDDRSRPSMVMGDFDLSEVELRAVKAMQNTPKQAQAVTVPPKAPSWKRSGSVTARVTAPPPRIGIPTKAFARSDVDRGLYQCEQRPKSRILVLPPAERFYMPVVLFIKDSGKMEGFDPRQWETPADTQPYTWIKLSDNVTLTVEAK